MIILGIDPGSRHTGYGVIEIEGRKERVLEYGALHLDASPDHFWRLRKVYERVSQVAERCLPDVCAVEMPVYGQNPQSMLKLGRAQSAAVLAVLNRDIPVTEYTPAEVKKSVTGNGSASKQQVWYMIRSLLEITDADPQMVHDASDALAVALCHAHRMAEGPRGQYRDWKSFVGANPGRVGG